MMSPREIKYIEGRHPANLSDAPQKPPEDNPSATDSHREANRMLPRVKLTPSGYQAGLRLQSKSDGRLYQVDPTGAFRRITPKPLSKKARRKKEHV